jgi:hypothetical protein
VKRVRQVMKSIEDKIKDAQINQTEYDELLKQHMQVHKVFSKINDKNLGRTRV